MIRVSVLLGLCSFALGAYQPGTPGAPWTKEEVLAVKAKLRMSYAKFWWMPSEANRVKIVKEKMTVL